MLDLVFALLDDPLTRHAELRVSHAPLGVFEFKLSNDGLLVTSGGATTRTRQPYLTPSCFG